MSNSQMILIATPPAGMQVWCTNCGTSGEMRVYNGTTWKDLTGVAGAAGANGAIGATGITGLTGTAGSNATVTGTAPIAVTSGVVSLNDSGVTSSKLADASVTMAKINQAAASSGQVIKWNGTAWAPAADNDNTAAIANLESQMIDANDIQNTLITDLQTTTSDLQTTINNTIVTNTISGNSLTTTVNGTTSPAVTLPEVNGAETKVTAGTNVTVSGLGTTASPYVVNATGAAGTNSSVGGFTHYLGEAFNGGIIYYLYKGSDSIEHGLIVALTESTASWQSTATLINANRSWDGVYNTSLMTSSPAAVYIAGLGTGWYLPSIDELDKLYHNRFETNKALFTAGNTLLTKTANYWSSTENVATTAYSFTFFNGYATSNVKTTTFSVRGVRAF
jgi:hypothetical protein